MVALAAPTADGPFRLICEKLPAGEAGRTILPHGVVEINPDECVQIARVLRHRHVSVADAARYIGLLLHEAGHIAQWREDFTLELT